MVLGAKRYNHDYVDTFHLALDFEHRHHISITKLETMRKATRRRSVNGETRKRGRRHYGLALGYRYVYYSLFFPGSSFADTSLSQPEQALRH